MKLRSLPRTFAWIALVGAWSSTFGTFAFAAGGVSTVSPMQQPMNMMRDMRDLTPMPRMFPDTYTGTGGTTPSKSQKGNVSAANVSRTPEQRFVDSLDVFY